MPQKLARGFQLIFWGLVFWVVDVSLTVYFTTDSIKFDILPDIAGVFLIFLGSLFLFLQNRHFSGTIGKRYRVTATVLVFCGLLWFIHTLLSYLSLDSWLANMGFFKAASTILFPPLVFAGYYVCKHFQLSARIHWIVLGALMAMFYIGLLIFVFIVPDLFFINLYATSGLLATYGLSAVFFLYLFLVLYRTRKALLQ